MGGSEGVTRVPWTTGQGGDVACLVHCDGKVNAHHCRFPGNLDGTTTMTVKL